MTSHFKIEGSLDWLGTRYRTILDGPAQGLGLSIVDSLSPAGSGPPRHVHKAEDETFVILTGEVEFWIAGETFVRGPGETAHIPRGTEHTFRVTDGGPSHHLVVLTPGGFEGFFTDMAAGGFAIPDDMPSIIESAVRHNLEFTGPPLGVEYAVEGA